MLFLLIVSMIASSSSFTMHGRSQLAIRFEQKREMRLNMMQLDRRNFVAICAAGLFTQAHVASPAAALEPCPKGANNCWSSASTDKTRVAAWRWPSDQSRADAIVTLKQVLDSYPQAGQDNVDLGGWKVAVDELGQSGYSRIEFKSGIGNFAKFFNGGKPFVDDFEVVVGEESVSIRSSSRVGDSDFGVNAKRVNFIAAGLRDKGWAAPGVAA
mmetsp:Transcript_66989/g.111289  ORF Transcript_66989/g.111289 Transcript_66989/m.111289 type:complete len:213 (+) Transcript_66989:49-687(+)